jgi:hypothetical protein
MLQLDPLRLIVCLSFLNLREKVNLDHARLPLHSDERVIYSKFISVFLLPFLKTNVRQWGFWPKNDPVLVLDAKGREIKAKARNGSATT